MKNNIIAAKRKKRGNAPCKHCGKDIENGSEYISAQYSDGFLTRPMGAFHINCFEL